MENKFKIKKKQSIITLSRQSPLLEVLQLLSKRKAMQKKNNKKRKASDLYESLTLAGTERRKKNSGQ